LKPQSVLVDVNGYWPGPCPDQNPIIVGGLEEINWLTATGTICEQFPEPTFGQVGQMALDEIGRLDIGSVDQSCAQVLDKGALGNLLCCPAMSGYPSALALRPDGNVFVACSGDGVLRVMTPNGNVVDASFATGLEGAVSMAIAPPGIFHGNLFVACGDRVVEVDVTTGATSVFLSLLAVHGIAFDPAGVSAR
jgi:hypothetical protein